jgi:hypothetical protein
MMSVARVFLCLLLGTLVACDGDKPEVTVVPQPEPGGQARAETPVPVSPAVEPVTGAVPLESAPEAEPATPSQPADAAAPAPVVVRPVPPAAKPAPVLVEPLDLSLPDELAGQLADEASLAEIVEAPLLPPLFGDKVEEPHSFELGGRLIGSEGPDASLDSLSDLEGAEVELRFRR